MMIIDSQVHAYEANTPKRPWHSVTWTRALRSSLAIPTRNSSSTI